jgi:hypothetical protein
MAQIHYRANLSSAVYPMTVDKTGRSVIIPGPDQNFDRRIDAPGDTQRRSVGIPQVMYMENVLPSSEGYQSVGFLQVATIAASGGADLVTTFAVKINVSGGIVNSYFSFYSNGTYKYTNALATWPVLSVFLPSYPVATLTANALSFAVVRGVHYMHVRVTGYNALYRLDFPAAIPTWTLVTPTLPGSVSLSSILYITGAYNYLILITTNLVLWSSTTTPLDFAPSLVSGAGNEFPNDLDGEALFCKPHPDGFYIYSTSNIIFGQYTGNQRYPWKFREINNSSGFSVPTQSSGSANYSVHFCLPVSGHVQAVNPDNAEGIAPEVTNFISRTVNYNKFNISTAVFTEDPMDPVVEINYMLDRYLMVKVGKTQQYIVFDMLLKRYGKLNPPFSSVFLFEDKSELYFINPATRIIYKLEFAREIAGAPTFAHSSVFVIGMFKYAKSRFINVDEILVDSVPWNTIFAGRNFSLKIIPSLDGTNLLPAVTPYDNSGTNTSSRLAKYLAHTSCHSFALALTGAFDLNTIDLVFHPEGDR